MSRRAVFFDRDDTLMWNVPYLADPAKVRIMDDAPAVLRDLAALGLDLFIVSNQSGVGRGLVTLEQLKAVNAELVRQLGTGFFKQIYSSHAEPGRGGSLETRKPSPQLLFQAAREHGLDLRESFFVGDRLADILCGRNAGCRTALVRTGENEKEWEHAARFADFSGGSLAEVGRWIAAEAAR